MLIWLLHVPFKIAYVGIAICNLKSTHKDPPTSSPNLQLLQTSNNTKQSLAVDFTIPLFIFPFG